jgi:eukaryotic-like serine/threonine-protein kinase
LLDTLPLDTPLGSHYQLEQLLGRGASAKVYLARDLRHGRQVALKVIRPELAATVARGRFLREIHVAGRLQHPHIVPMLESGEAQGQLWYAMPYVRGESLRQLLDRERALPVDMAVELARQLARALDYAHREGIVHRDLKPENILLSDGQALIADFGLAKALEAGGERLTANGMAVGTAAYISPEQATSGEVDGRSDLYSLGCLLYEMLAGQPAFTGPSVQRIIALRFTMPPPSVQVFRPEVPNWLDEVVRRLLALDPAERLANGAEVARALVSPAVEAVDDRSVAQGTVGIWWAARWVVPLVVAVIAGLVGRGWLAP